MTLYESLPNTRWVQDYDWLLKTNWTSAWMALSIERLQSPDYISQYVPSTPWLDLLTLYFLCDVPSFQAAGNCPICCGQHYQVHHLRHE